jgi:hypothetical protein
MKLAIGCLTIASAMSIAAATSCTHQVASAWPYTKPEPCDTVACAQAQAAEEAYANCVAVSQFDSSMTCVKPPRRLKRDVDLVCISSETCTVFTDNSLLCLEEFNGGYFMRIIISYLNISILISCARQFPRRYRRQRKCLPPNLHHAKRRCYDCHTD